MVRKVPARFPTNGMISNKPQSTAKNKAFFYTHYAKAHPVQHPKHHDHHRKTGKVTLRHFDGIGHDRIGLTFVLTREDLEQEPFQMVPGKKKEENIHDNQYHIHGSAKDELGDGTHLAASFGDGRLSIHDLALFSIANAEILVNILPELPGDTGEPFSYFVEVGGKITQLPLQEQPDRGERPQ